MNLFLSELPPLENFLKKNKLWYRFINKPETVHTADAASVTGISITRITKNLVSQTDSGEYVLLVVPGDRRVNIKKAATVLGVKNVSTIPFNEAESISGFPPGGTPTVGHKMKMFGKNDDKRRGITRTVIDRPLLNYETIFCGGGSREKLLELKVKEILNLDNNIIVADIAE